MRLLFAALLFLSGCISDREVAAPDAEVRPRLEAAIRAHLGPDLADDPPVVRYFSGQTDLDGDGEDEALAYLVGPYFCGTGGCSLLVLTPDGDSYRVVAELSSVRDPVLVAPRASEDRWRDLVVHIGGGGGASGAVVLSFDGTTYPDNPTVLPVTGIPEGAEEVIPVFESVEEARLLLLD